MTPRAFIAAHSDRFDTARVADHAEVHYLFGPGESRPGALKLAKVYDQLCTRLQEREFDPESDFAVMTGPAIYVAAFMTAVIDLYGEGKFLCFHAGDETYVVRDLYSAHIDD